MNGFTYCNPVKVVYPHGDLWNMVYASHSNVPASLGEKGVTAADIPGIVEGVKTVSFNADGVLASNPPVGAEMLAEILEGAL